MMDRLDEIREELEALSLHDFDDMNESASGMERIYALCDDLVERDDPENWMPLLFSFVERLGEADLGSPGPIVHALEQTGRAYWPLLADSVSRKPTPLTVWMINRVLNGNPQDRSYWIRLLEGVEYTPSASASSIGEAQKFLAFQRSR